MNIEKRTILIPRKEGTTTNEKPVTVWPLVEEALNRIEADPPTYDAARAAMEHSDGCAVLANYLNSEAKRVHRMDYRFKVPLIVMAAEMARTDDRADSVFDPEEEAIYFETDLDQYSFHVFKDWTVDWEAVADEIISGYEWIGVENQTWALDRLMDFLEVDVEKYLRQEEE